MLSMTESAPKIELAIPDLSGNESRYLQQCIESSFVSSVGPFVGRFETLVAAATGARECVATTSGTAGLHVALTAVGAGRDDLVILASFTFIGSANAIAQCGATPWLFDIDRSTWNLDPAALEDHLRHSTRRTSLGCIHVGTGRRVAAIMPVYALGAPADMDAIVRIARAYGLPVVADAAAALGATLHDRALAQLGADLSVLSFNGNKTVTCGGGGGVIGTDPELCRRVRHLSTTARVGKDYDHDVVGFNYRMTNLQAAVGCAQMERLNSLLAKKKAIRSQYAAAFADIGGLTTFPPVPPTASPCWLSGIVASDDETAATLRQALRAAGIEARKFWKPIHLQRPYRDAPATPQPVAEALWERVVVLPSSSGLDQSALDRVISTVREAMKARRA